MAELMIDRTQAQFTLHGFEGSLDLRELDVTFPQHGRIFPSQIRAQQIMSIPLFRFTELVFVRREGERLARDLFVGLGHANRDEPKCPSSFFLGSADTQ